MKVICIDGRLSIINEFSQSVLSSLTCLIRYNGNHYNTVEAANDGKWTLNKTKTGWCAVCNNAKMHFTPHGKSMTVYTEYTNLNDDIGVVKEFVALRGFTRDRINTLLGNEIVLPNGNRVNEMCSAVETIKLVDSQSYNSGDFCAFKDDAGDSFIAGYLTYNNYFGSVKVCRDTTVEVSEFTEYHSLKNGQTITSDVFYITECDDIIAELPNYAELVSEYMNTGEKRRHFPVPTGYCTWYYFLSEIDKNKIDNAEKDLIALKDKLPVKYIQIDDGWQNCWGDWEPNPERFPDGMKAVADQIKAAGYTPGLWLAPFGAAEDSKIFKEHPEYFIRNWGADEARKGAWGYYDLDYSVEGAKKYLAELIRKVTYEWGFEYLKIDIVTSTIGPYQHSNPDFTAVKNYREGMKIITQSAPDNTFILGCTAPFGSSVGLVDGMRIGCDIFERWESVCDVFNRVLKRYFYHKRLFINDADCLLVRKAENEDSECRRLCVRNDDEIRSFVAAMAASGGALMISDKLSLLSDEQIKLLNCLLPLNEAAAIPLDLMDSRIPGVLDVGVKGKTRTVILINWDNSPKTMSVDCTSSYVFEFWSSKFEGEFSGKYTTEIAPHCSKVLFFTPSDTPAVIGCDDMIVPAIEQEYSNGVLTTRFVKNGERLYIAANNVESANCEYRKLTDGLFEIMQTGDIKDVTLKLKI